jgi:hypothetical protein
MKREQVYQIRFKGVEILGFYQDKNEKSLNYFEYNDSLNLGDIVGNDFTEKELEMSKFGLIHRDFDDEYDFSDDTILVYDDSMVYDGNTKMVSSDMFESISMANQLSLMYGKGI